MRRTQSAWRLYLLALSTIIATFPLKKETSAACRQLFLLHVLLLGATRRRCLPFFGFGFFSRPEKEFRTLG
jgi:hypothetical protein